MRATLNILFGVLLLVMQSMASLAPHTLEQELPCQCCSCGSKSCATTQRVPAPPVSPLAVAETAREAAKTPKGNLSAVSSPRTVKPVLKETSCSVDFSSTSRNLPLHQRLCVLLI